MAVLLAPPSELRSMEERREEDEEGRRDGREKDKQREQ